MTELFLDNHRVQISSDQSIKLSRENPSVTSSGDYTLDVECPLSILDNRLFFGSWNRIDKEKIIKPYAARMYVNNICVVNGSAKVTGINNEAVKIQLYGDRSEFNAVFGDLYIDELELPYFHRSNGSGGFGGSRSKVNIKTDDGYKPVHDKNLQIDYSIKGVETFVFPSIYNEGSDEVINIYSSAKMKRGNEEVHYGDDGRTLAQFNLFYVLKCVFKAIGYKLNINDYDRYPFNHLFIASCISSAEMRHVLPHWTFREFITQLQNFFNCVFVFSSSSLNVTMAKVNSETVSKNITLKNEDVFNIDIEDDDSNNSRYAQTLHYNMSDSEYHDTDYFDEEKLQQLPVKEYPSYDKLIEAFNVMSEYDKGNYLLRCPEGDYCQWIYQGVNDEKTKIKKLIHVNQFGDLIKGEEGNSLDLKICPVAIAESVPVPLYVEAPEGHGHSKRFVRLKDSFCYQSMPAMTGREKESNGTFVGGKIDEPVILDTTEIQNLIMSDGTAAGYEKPDRMELFFWDGYYQQATEFEFSGREVIVNAPAAFTAYDHKDIKHINHFKWSMTLNKDVWDVKTIGECHRGMEIRRQQRYTIRFISDIIPSPSDIYIINNKKFYAEKIEIEITDGKMSPLMTGYFYGMQ